MSPEAHELILYADNDGNLYRVSFLPIMKNLARKIQRREYKKELAIRSWMYHAEIAAKQYEKEYLNPGEWKIVFPMSARREAARHWENRVQTWVRENSRDRSYSRRYSRY
jgi:hypothetical protein